LQIEDISEEESPKNFLRIERLIWIWAGGLTFVFIFAWPLLALPAGILSKVRSIAAAVAHPSAAAAPCLQVGGRA
jgi:hypothetical protein